MSKQKVVPNYENWNQWLDKDNIKWIKTFRAWLIQKAKNIDIKYDRTFTRVSPYTNKVAVKFFSCGDDAGRLERALKHFMVDCKINEPVPGRYYGYTSVTAYFYVR